MVYVAWAEAGPGSASPASAPTQASCLARRGELRSRRIRFQACLQAPSANTDPKTRLGLRCGRSGDPPELRVSAVPEPRFGRPLTAAVAYNRKRAALKQSLFQLKAGDEIHAVNTAETYDEMLSELADASQVRLCLERKLPDVFETPRARNATAAMAAAVALPGASPAPAGSAPPRARSRRCARAGTSSALDDYIEGNKVEDDDSTGSSPSRLAKISNRVALELERQSPRFACRARRSQADIASERVDHLLSRVKEVLSESSGSSTREPSPSVSSDSSLCSGFPGQIMS